MSENKALTENWSAETKFVAVLEAAGLSEIDLGEYCRRKGLYPEQITTWRQAFITGQKSEKPQQKEDREQSRKDKKRIQELERELRRKTRRSLKQLYCWCCEKAQRLLGDRQRGQLTSLPERQLFVDWLSEAAAAGARKRKVGLRC